MKEIKILTWNLGSALCDEKYFKGKYHLFGNNIKTIKSNIKNQINILKEVDADIYLLQEVSKPSIHNWFLNQYKRIKNNFREFNNNYLNNYNIPLLIINGKAVITKDENISDSFCIPFNSKILKNDIKISNKNNIITRIKIKKKELVIFNIHLAPYGRQKELRIKQISYIFDKANDEYNKGNYVIIGGDWNMDISKISNNGFIIAKPDLPTCRDINTPYMRKSKMNSYDGFIYSNNIKLKDINVINNFKYSDHCPVIADFIIK